MLQGLPRRRLRRGELLAVRDVSFAVQPGEVVSLIGESGSGKSTIGKMILRLLRVTRGTVSFDGVDISTLQGRELKQYYAAVQGVFQDPFSSYNPIFKADRVFTMLRSAYFSGSTASEWHAKLERSLEAVSLNPSDVLNKYPHQLSGGQLQRMLIARALLLDIRLLVADEIISMLDASTRIDVLNLLGELKARGLGILFITHDLSLGNYISDKTIILRRGSVVEIGPTTKVFGNPVHPYTKLLLECVPQLHTKWGARSAPRPGVGQRCRAGPGRDRARPLRRGLLAERPRPGHHMTDRLQAVAPATAAAPAIPWEERPGGTDGVLWRSSRNPVIPRNLIPRANSIFNSAVVPFGGGFAGVFRVDDTHRTMNLHAGRSDDGLDWQLDHDPIAFRPADARVAEIQQEFVHAYDPRVTWLETATTSRGATVPRTDDRGRLHARLRVVPPARQRLLALQPQRRALPAPHRRSLRDAQPAQRRRPHAVRRHLLLGEPRPRPLGPPPARAGAGAVDVGVDEGRRRPDPDRDGRGLARDLPRRLDVVQRLRLLDGCGTARPRRAVARALPQPRLPARAPRALRAGRRRPERRLSLRGSRRPRAGPARSTTARPTPSSASRTATSPRCSRRSAPELGSEDPYAEAATGAVTRKCRSWAPSSDRPEPAPGATSSTKAGRFQRSYSSAST